eukprot:jgi/Mesvir1/6005/Mv00752-RA.1
MTQSILPPEIKQLLSFDETASEFLARTHVEPLRTGVFFIDKCRVLRAGDVLEITGDSGSGKTEVLIQAAATCVLPNAINGVTYGGNNASLVVYDLELGFDLERLSNVLKARIRAARAAHTAGAPSGPADTESALVAECLSRVHVYICNGSFSFLAALKSADYVLRGIARNAPRGVHLRMLLINGMSSFYFMDKAGAFALARNTEGRSVSGVLGVMTVVARELRCLLQTHRLVVLVSTNSLSYQGGKLGPGGGGGGGKPNSRGTAPPQLYQLPAVWRDFPTHRVVLSPPTDQAGVFSSTWENPSRSRADRFTITEGSLRPCL